MTSLKRSLASVQHALSVHVSTFDRSVRTAMALAASSANSLADAHGLQRADAERRAEISEKKAADLKEETVDVQRRLKEALKDVEKSNEEAQRVSEECLQAQQKIVKIDAELWSEKDAARVATSENRAMKEAMSEMKEKLDRIEIEKKALETREYNARSENNRMRMQLSATAYAETALSRQRDLITYINQLSEKGNLKDVGPPPAFTTELLTDGGGGSASPVMREAERTTTEVLHGSTAMKVGSSGNSKTRPV